LRPDGRRWAAGVRPGRLAPAAASLLRVAPSPDRLSLEADPGEGRVALRRRFVPDRRSTGRGPLAGRPPDSARGGLSCTRVPPRGRCDPCGGLPRPTPGRPWRPPVSPVTRSFALERRGAAPRVAVMAVLAGGRAARVGPGAGPLGRYDSPGPGRGADEPAPACGRR